MSLVNDMLRDLDKRRNESGNSSGSVKLTPAPEIHLDNKKSLLLYVIVALVIGAGAVAWFWTQQGSNNTTRQLDIAPLVVDRTELTTPEESEEEAQSAEPLVESAVAIDEPEDFDPVALLTQASEENLDEADQRDAPNGGQDEVVTNPGQNLVVSQEDAHSDPVEEVATTSELSTDNESSLANEISGSEQQPALVDLSNSEAPEVKNSAELTPEETDLLAVQEALALIADNKNAEAYGVLEQQIVENRYAHQSRETYAKLLISEGNLLGAYELNEAGLMLSPNHSGFKKIKARLLIADGQLDAAVALLLTRAPAVDVDLEYHDILATAQLASRDFEGALISYTELVQQDQNQGKWWYGFAASQDSLGNSNAARQGYSQAVRLTNLSASLRRRSQERLSVLSQ